MWEEKKEQEGRGQEIQRVKWKKRKRKDVGNGEQEEREGRRGVSKFGV